MDQLEKDVFEPHARPGSRRIAFCPTCGRPFTHGSGFYQKSCIDSIPLHKGGKTGEPAECKEYCSESCVPGIPA